MSVMGFFQPASLGDGRRLVVRDGLGEGIRVEGAVLEGKVSVGLALAGANGYLSTDSRRAFDELCDRAEMDRVWAKRTSVFG